MFNLIYLILRNGRQGDLSSEFFDYTRRVSLRGSTVHQLEQTKKRSPGQMNLPWDDWEANKSEIREIAEEFAAL